MGSDVGYEEDKQDDRMENVMAGIAQMALEYVLGEVTPK